MKIPAYAKNKKLKFIYKDCEWRLKYNEKYYIHGTFSKDNYIVGIKGIYRLHVTGFNKAVLLIAKDLQKHKQLKKAFEV